MKSLFEILKDYLSKTPKEEVIKKWNSLKEFDKIGISVDQFLKQQEENNKNLDKFLQEIEKENKIKDAHN